MTTGGIDMKKMMKVMKSTVLVIMCLAPIVLLVTNVVLGNYEGTALFAVLTILMPFAALAYSYDASEDDSVYF